MAISSIHIEAGHGGYFAHNSREAHTVNSVFSDEPNFCSCTKEEAFETYRSELEKRAEAYTDRTGQKLQKNAITHLSAIVNFNKEHTPEDMQKVCDLLERRFDTKVIQLSMHRDEGKSIDDKNYHAHIEFMGLDSKGESVRRKLDRPTLKALQTDVATILKMERGHDYAKERLPRPKRLGTYEYKVHKKALEEQMKDLSKTYESLPYKERIAMRLEMREILGENDELKSLKEELKALKEAQKAERAELKDQGATRADYAQMEAKYKEMEAELKELRTVPHEPINARMIANLQSEKEMLQITNRVLEREVAELKENRTAVDVSKEIDKQIEAIRIPTVSVEGGVDHDESALVKYRSAIENQGKNATPEYFEKLMDEHSGTFGKLDRKALAKQLATEKKEDYRTAASVYNVANELIKYKDKAKEVIKTVVQSSKTALEAVKSKITGKSIDGAQKEREGLNLSNTDRIRGFVDQHNKEQEKPKSRGMER